MASLSTYRKSYVFAGVGAVVVLALVTSAIDPTGRLAVVVTAPAAVALFAGILLYQWKWAGEQNKVPAESLLKGAPSDDPGQIDDYWQMYAAMATGPIDVEALNKAQRSVMDMVRDNIKLGAFIGILPLLGAVMVITGYVPDLGSGKYVLVLPIILAPAALAWARYQMAGAADAAVDTLAPLGLKLTGMPTVSIGRDSTNDSGMGSNVSGASVMEGVRHGRKVKISLGKRHVTVISGAVPEFKIKRRGDKLEVEGKAPAKVEDLIADLGPSKKWKALRSVTGGADGIRAERSVDAESGWMWDLWLAEHLADAAGAPKDATPVEAPPAQEVPWILQKDS